MKKGEQKYPTSLFIMGFILNLIRKAYILFPALILLVVGIWSEKCLIVGLVLLGFVIIISFIEQMRIRNTALNLDDKSFKEALLSPDWVNNVKNIVESKIQDSNDDERDE